MESLYTLKPFFYWAGVLIFLLIEIAHSYRLPTVSKTQRWLTNLPLSIINGSVYHFLFTASLIALAHTVEVEKLGLLNTIAAPLWLKIVLGILVLDFFIYLWHLLTHSIPLLWRFHRVHHSDLNMDVSTANRFHLGEFLVTGLLRMAIIYTFGIPWPAYVIFEIVVNLSVQFHHSALKLSPTFQKAWALLFVPPSLHRIHHSQLRKECDSNYGVIFSLWDRLAGTLVTEVDQDKIIIGSRSHQDFEKLSFWDLQVMPFKK